MALDSKFLWLQRQTAAKLRIASWRSLITTFMSESSVVPHTKYSPSQSAWLHAIILLFLFVICCIIFLWFIGVFFSSPSPFPHSFFPSLLPSFCSSCLNCLRWNRHIRLKPTTSASLYSKEIRKLFHFFKKCIYLQFGKNGFSQHACGQITSYWKPWDKCYNICNWNCETGTPVGKTLWQRLLLFYTNDFFFLNSHLSQGKWSTIFEIEKNLVFVACNISTHFYLRRRVWSQVGVRDNVSFIWRSGGSTTDFHLSETFQFFKWKKVMARMAGDKYNWLSLNSLLPMRPSG